MPDFFKSVNKRVNRPSAVKQVGLPPFMVRKNTDLSPYLLDQFSGAAAAYSVRRLSSSYSGSALRVRRASDNAEVDIGFIGENLDTARLEAHCAGTDGFVVTWYDQSGGGNDVSNSTSSQQPQIVSLGTIIKDNQKPVISFDGTDDYLRNPSVILGSQPITTFSVQTRIGTINPGAFFDAATNRLMLDDTGSNYRMFGGASLVSTNYPGPQTLASCLFNSVSSELYLNGSLSRSGDAGSDTPTGVTIGANSSTFDNNTGYQSELIIYISNKSSQRSSIERNINRYFNIYWDGSRQGILDTYSGASAAYSVRALNSAYTGPLLRVRRSSDNAEKDIYALYDGNLDTASMEAFCPAQDGFVVTWYDQSGSGINWTQAVAINQMQIVSTGSTILKGGKPAPTADGSVDTYTFSAVPMTGFLFSVMECNGAANYQPLFGDLIVTGLTSGGSKWEMRKAGDGSVLITTTDSATIQSVVTYNLAANNAEIWVNGSSGGTDVTTNAYADATQSLKASGVTNFGGEIQEIIVYPDDQSSNRSNIETNINDYYAVY